jgi:CRISPR/Cas system endoribonuclease Cas6 (RAMP superfamily)
MCNTVDCDTVTSAFIRDTYVLSSGEVIRILNVGFYEFEPNNNGTNGRSIIEWSVKYYPTVFPYMHHYILHPSPARFFASTAKTFVQLLKGTEVALDKDGELYNATINSINTKDLIKDLVFNTELIDFKVNKLRINLGRGRSTLAFYGTAEYVTETENTSLFNTLLDVAEFFGVGKNRALGLGFVKITQRNIKKPETVRPSGGGA